MLCLRLELAHIESAQATLSRASSHAAHALLSQQQNRIRRFYEQTLTLFHGGETIDGVEEGAASALWQEYEAWERSFDEHEKANLVQWRGQRNAATTAEASIEESADHFYNKKGGTAEKS
jgi:hypothetical protein